MALNRTQLEKSLALWRERETRYRKNWRSKKRIDPRRAYWFAQLKIAKSNVAKRTKELSKLPVNTVSDAGVDLIKSFEGFRSKPYLPTPNDVWTIGYGHTEGVTKNSRPITEREAAELLRKDVNKKYAPAVAALRLPLTQNQFDALTSFVYNVGPGGVAANTGVGRALRAHDWASAANHLLDWDKQAGHTLPGLTRRRKAERALFLKH